MVFTSRESNSTARAIIITAIRDAGTLGNILGIRMRIARDITPTRTAVKFTEPNVDTISSTFSTVSTGEFLNVRPKKSFICPISIVTAIPPVKPTVID